MVDDRLNDALAAVLVGAVRVERAEFNDEELLTPTLDVPAALAILRSSGYVMVEEEWLEELRERAEGPPEKWGFRLLMKTADRLLEEVYPRDIFTGKSGDPGPDLLVALRACREAMQRSTPPEEKTG